MHTFNLGTWLSAISLGAPQDIPPGFLFAMMRRGYCDSQYRINLLRIPTELYTDCHSNLNRPVDHYSRIMREFISLQPDE